MTTIFEHTDSDGDFIEVEPETTEGPYVSLGINITDRLTGEVGSVWLTRGAVDRLRAALAPYGTVEAKPATAIVEGREYRLLPNAETLPGMESSAVADCVTRVRVVNPDSGYRNGTVRVKGLDGRASEYIVQPKYLAPLTEEPAPITAEILAAPDLDPRRVAAIDKAAAILTEHFDEVDTVDVQSVAAFLLGEAA